MRKTLILLTMVLTCALLAPLGVHANICTWTGNRGNDWKSATGANTSWAPHKSLPNAYADQAIINVDNNNPVIISSGDGTILLGGGGIALTIGTSAGSTALDIQSGATLGMQGSISNVKIITLEGTLRNDDTPDTHYTIGGTGGSITLGGGTISSNAGGVWDFNQAVSGYGTISATVINNSIITANKATFLGITGALTNSGTGVLNAGTSILSPTGTLAFGTGSSLNNSGTVNVYGTLRNTGSALALTGASGNAYLYGGTLSGLGGFSNANNLSGYGLISARLTNNGTLTAHGSGQILTVTGAVSGNGNVAVGVNSSDNATLALQNDLTAANFTLNQSASLNSIGTITLSGNFYNAATSTSQWLPPTGINLVMGGTGSTFSTFEVAGKDYGAGFGFSNNFNLASLVLNGNLELLDSVDNNNRTGIHGPQEALYITSLTGSGTLDLNHYWLYVMEGVNPIALSNGLYTYNGSSIQVNNSPVPIPASFLLLGSGLLGICLLRFRRGGKKT